ncbi:MAG: hypothetical protein CK431_26925 [Mycobacterium sp.]|nr:MAG: hypothetical protein CK431_26925 [Mycobacterium sp.]
MDEILLLITDRRQQFAQEHSIRIQQRSMLVPEERADCLTGAAIIETKCRVFVVRQMRVHSQQAEHSSLHGHERL